MKKESTLKRLFFFWVDDVLGLVFEHGAEVVEGGGVDSFEGFFGVEGAMWGDDDAWMVDDHVVLEEGVYVAGFLEFFGVHFDFFGDVALFFEYIKSCSSDNS